VAGPGARMYAPRPVTIEGSIRRSPARATPEPSPAANDIVPPSPYPSPRPSPVPAAMAGVDLPPGGGATDTPILPASPRGSFLWRLRGMIGTLRPHQWVKNLFVLAPVVFAKHLTNPVLIRDALGAFFAFCLLAGAVYTLNDLVDVEADRIHPVKRYRPIASGCVPVPVAKGMVVVLVLIALGGSALGPPLFLATMVAYFVQNLAYSFRLKKIAYLDVACIAFGFVLRVLAGGFATGTHVSGYMIACTALLALFLGFGKRRHELGSANAGKQRAALTAYSPRVLTIALAVTGFAATANYLAYTLDPETIRFFNSPWFWVTTIHTVFGVIRFLQLVAGRPKAESPTQVMLRDTPFVLNLVFWGLEVIGFVYHVRLSTT
jgi:decaprenyl-phosphate phosphoribosyltransferase